MKEWEKIVYDFLLEQKDKLEKEQYILKERIESLKNSSQLCEKCYKECMAKLSKLNK